MISAITLFCEDIRHERNGIESLVGLLPDNISLPEFPSTIAKLGIYTRITFSAGEEPQPFELIVTDVLGTEISLTKVGSDDLEKIRSSVSSDTKFFGLKSISTFINYSVPHEGSLHASIRFAGRNILTGGLNFKQQT